MSYRIEQDFEYVGNDYWRWSAWIEASDEELDRVGKVRWVLHPSFPQPHVVSTDREAKFRLRTAGWGIFTLQAEVSTTDQKTRVLKHSLRLEYPKDSGLTDTARRASLRSSKPATVFLSYSGQHARAASRLRKDLQDAGLNVLDQTRIKPGEPWAEAIEQMIAVSDSVVGLVEDDEVSPWVNAELESAVEAAKPVLSVSFRTQGAQTSRSPSGLPGRLGALQVLSIDPAEPDTAAITEAIGRLTRESSGFLGES